MNRRVDINGAAGVVFRAGGVRHQHLATLTITANGGHVLRLTKEGIDQVRNGIGVIRLFEDAGIQDAIGNTKHEHGVMLQALRDVVAILDRFGGDLVLDIKSAEDLAHARTLASIKDW